VRGAPAPRCPYSFVRCGPTTLAGADLVLLNGLMIDDGAKNLTLPRAAVPVVHGLVLGIASQQWRSATPEWARE
jgi:hypothetical protein